MNSNSKINDDISKTKSKPILITQNHLSLNPNLKLSENIKEYVESPLYDPTRINRKTILENSPPVRHFIMETSVLPDTLELTGSKVSKDLL